MTSDHDPRELREAARRCKHLGWDEAAAIADYVLATVRDDDGEEQPDVTIRLTPPNTLPHDFIGVNANGIYANSVHGICVEELVWIKRGRPTRGQFRDLCRGLGIIEPTRD